MLADFTTLRVDALFVDLANLRTTLFQPRIPYSSHHPIDRRLDVVITLRVKIHVEHVQHLSPLARLTRPVFTRESRLNETGSDLRLGFYAEATRIGPEVLNQPRRGFGDLCKLVQGFAVDIDTAPGLYRLVVEGRVHSPHG